MKSEPRIAIPNPSSFCLHKLLIALRRKNNAKDLKDKEQAILTFLICDKKYLVDTYNQLPKPWKKKIISTLENALDTMPLHKNTIKEMVVTLQE